MGMPIQLPRCVQAAELSYVQRRASDLLHALPCQALCLWVFEAQTLPRSWLRSSIQIALYAEVMAGIGCRCSCCLSVPDVLESMDFLIDDLRGANQVDIDWRAEVRQLLDAVGNPECMVRTVLEHCEMCEGAA